MNNTEIKNKPGVIINNYDNNGKLSQINELHLEVFKENVKEWLTLDDDIKTLNSHLRDRKKRKNELTPDILKFMQEYEIQDMNTNSGLIKYNQTLVKKPMNKEFIRKKLSDFLKNSKTADDATEYITQNRDSEIKIKLKRVNNKK